MSSHLYAQQTDFQNTPINEISESDKVDLRQKQKELHQLIIQSVALLTLDMGKYYFD